MNDAIPMSNGPHPAPRKPDFRLPEGTCDTHCHAFGPVERFPYAPERKYTPAETPKESLAALHAHLGVGRAVIQQASSQGTDNRTVLDAIASAPERYRGVVMITPEVPDAELQALDAGGITGARFTFLSSLGGTPDMAGFVAMMERIGPLGWHADLHAQAEDIPPFAEMAEKMGVHVVLDHMGRITPDSGPAPLDALIDVMQCPNIWVKVTNADRFTQEGAPFADVAFIARALVDAAPDRVLWGTDWPHVNAPGGVAVDDGDLVDFVASYLPEPELRQKLLVDNPARLYGFAPGSG